LGVSKISLYGKRVYQELVFNSWVKLMRSKWR
jgi:hypothetical protein